MISSRLKAVIALALMVAAVGGAAAWKPTRHLADMRPVVKLETLFPTAFGDWTVDSRMPVQLISPDQAEMLSKIYSQTLSRTYVNTRTGERVMLSVAYGGDQSDATRAHRPEVCYPAQGFQVTSSRHASLSTGAQTLPVRQLTARLGARTEPISYWIVVGDRIALSGTEQKLAQLSYSVRGVIPDGMLVRVSNISTDADASFRLHSSFVSALARSVSGAEAERVLGRQGA